eukprot:scaffold124474_cov69-Phaeocystis_antarctica.AAC.3
MVGCSVGHRHDWQRNDWHNANTTTIHTRGARLIVAIRADDGALALQTPIHLHRRAGGCARSNAAAAKAKRGGEGGGVERGKCALPLAAARLLDWGLRHGNDVRGGAGRGGAGARDVATHLELRVRSKAVDVNLHRGKHNRAGGDARQRECVEAVDVHVVEVEPLRAMACRVEDSERSHAIVHAQLLHRRKRRLVPIHREGCVEARGAVAGTERWRGRRLDGRLAERAGQQGTRVAQCEAKRVVPGKSLRGRGCRRGRVQTKAARRSPG